MVKELTMLDKLKEEYWKHFLSIGITGDFDTDENGLCSCPDEDFCDKRREALLKDIKVLETNSQDTKPPISIGENRLGARDKIPDSFHKNCKQDDLACGEHGGMWYLKCDKCYKNYIDYMEQQRNIIHKNCEQKGCGIKMRLSEGIYTSCGDTYKGKEHFCGECWRKYNHKESVTEEK